jgi:hypothetical protein
VGSVGHFCQMAATSRSSNATIDNSGSSDNVSNNIASVNETATINATNCQIRAIKVNSSGQKIAILTDQLEGALKVCHPDSRLHVFDRSKGQLAVFDFAKLSRCPTSVFWEEIDDRMFACEAIRNKNSSPAEKAKNSSLHGQQGDGNHTFIIRFLFIVTMIAITIIITIMIAIFIEVYFFVHYFFWFSGDVDENTTNDQLVIRQSSGLNLSNHSNNNPNNDIIDKTNSDQNEAENEVEVPSHTYPVTVPIPTANTIATSSNQFSVTQ